MSVTAVEDLKNPRENSDLVVPPAQDARSPSSGLLKRKRDEAQSPQLDLADIYIRPYPGTIYDQPFLLRPLRLVPRSRLPLTFLDVSAESALLSANRIFSANIAALEHENVRQNCVQVLIASLSESSELYAIERVKSRTYALCKLFSWVCISYIEDDTQEVPRASSNSVADNAAGKWWSNIAASDFNPGVLKKRIKLVMAPRSTGAFVNHPALQTPPDLVSMPALTTALPSETPASLPATNEISLTSVLEAPKTDEEVCETLVRQYLDAIYISKTSLAFFVKGPLSRARNHFSNEQGPAQLTTLASQVRSMIMSTSQMDKKYKEKLPEWIKGFPAHVLYGEECDSPVKVKKRRSKKMPKLSRDGCYSIEEDYCRRWWTSKEVASAKTQPDETFDQILRRRTGDLRRRETLAQITLILEVLALESAPGFNFSANREREPEATEIRHSVQTQRGSGDETNNTKKPTRGAKKPQDLDLLLDLLLDKLSIWQSIEQDLGDLLGNDKKSDIVTKNSGKLHEQDILISYCTDVVIPFYKSRILPQATMVNKKLGGPGAVSPAKPEKAKPAAKPGDRRSRKPLQKTLSETHGFIRSRQPSSSRSATDLSGMPRPKREASEFSLLDVPLAKPSHRDSASQLRHLQSRQVDLTAISTATEAKLKQKAKIDQDLNEAINILKRPNRPEAVRELADAADKRSLGSASMRKKTMAPVKKVLQNVRNVQVTATPKHRRVGDVFAAQKMSTGPDLFEPHAPSPGQFYVPSSGVRATRSDFVDATPAMSRVRREPMAITATPSRRASKSLDDVDELHETPARATISSRVGTIPASTQQQCAKPSFQDFMKSQLSRIPPSSTPLKPTSHNMTVESTPIKAPTIFATPAKPSHHSSPPMVFDDTASTPFAGTAEAPHPLPIEANIYDALGWNDYDD